MSGTCRCGLRPQQGPALQEGAVGQLDGVQVAVGVVQADDLALDEVAALLAQAAAQAVGAGQ
ncbi:hypothetical protein [Streptomyces sp. YPW6]|uniref:hypothetical protein n=1 Tax=Streptomyces sp. YPW6 TaxID=2840373 RepID=UPI003EB94393